MKINLQNTGSGLCLSMGVIALLGLDNARAASGTWTNTAGGTWSTTTNWSGGAVADGQNSLADFSTLDIINLDRLIELDSGRTIGDLSFGDTSPSHNWTLQSTNNSVLTLKNTGSGAASDITVNASTTATVSLVLNHSTPENTNKLGGGTLILSGANTLKGQTNASFTVSQGTLLANNTSGSATGTMRVNVNSGARLGGSGTIAPDSTFGINVSGVLSPGASIGSIGNLTLNLGATTGVVTMNTGSTFQYELGVAGANIAAFGTSDLLTIAGAGANDFVFNGNVIDFQNTGAIGFYKLFDTSSDNATTWSGLTFDSITGVISSGLSFTNLAGALLGNLIVGTASNGGTTGDIYLQVVPEPAAACLGGLGLLALLRRRRVV